MNNLEKRLNLLLVQRRDLKIAIGEAQTFKQCSEACKQFNAVCEEIVKIATLLEWDDIIDEEPTPLDCYDGDGTENLPC
jgi:hypothetical protein